MQTGVFPYKPPKCLGKKLLNFIAGIRQSPPAISSQHLLLQAQAYKATENSEEAKKWYQNAVEQAKTEHERNPGDSRAKINFDTICQEYFTFLHGLEEPDTTSHFGEQSPASHSPNQLHLINGNDVPTQRLLSVQRAQDAAQALSSATQPSFFEKRSSHELVASVPSALTAAQELPTASLIHEKSRQVNYLFETALLTLQSLELSNKTSLFLVYAHDNAAYGRADADTSKYLIEKLSQIRGNLYSDQTPMGQSYVRASEALKEDILTSQLCLLPTQLKDNVEPVEKVVVCCSEVLGNYLKWEGYPDFYKQVKAAYEEDCKEPGNLKHIRSVIRAFASTGSLPKDFHHVLTEMAFLQIREEKLGDEHGIIPVSLTPNSYEPCLDKFIDPTRVRINDITRFEAQIQAGKEVYLNQGQHLTLFKLIERLFVKSNEVQTFLDKFWHGYSQCISRLKNKPSALDWHEFTDLVDGIFKNIQIEQCRDQAWHLSETRALHTKIIQELLPPKPPLINLRKALYQHYQRSNLSIQRVSGKEMLLKDCYINLAIVESQAQREKDKKALEKQANTFERLPSGEQIEATNPNKLIKLDKLFEPQQLRNGLEGQPKRILIQGRAGIGKTTLCKKLVHEYYQNERWQDRFKSVLWIPLRELKTHSHKRLEDLLCNQYFAGHESSQAQALSKVFHAHEGETLFILDGLDEVASELGGANPLGTFLRVLLEKEYVVITSRPTGVNVNTLNNLDLELETVGFSQADVQTYIQKFAPKSDQAEIQQFINSTPVIQGLVNIPIQLDALCYGWNKLHKGPAVTMTILYQAIVNKLWCKDSIILQKKAGGELLKPHEIEYLTDSELEEVMVAEVDYLSYLAFKGLEANKIEFSLQELSDRRHELNKILVRRRELPVNFTTNLKKASYLHTADVERLESGRYYHFLHLTFQEFFAAKFLVRHLEKYAATEVTPASAKIASTGLGVMPSQTELETFIAAHKYNPRYEIVWWMVAGLLKGRPLERFFTLLEWKPRDLIGIRHQQVMMGCLNEARNQLSETRIFRLETELMQWVHFEIKQLDTYGHSQLGRQSTFPEHALLSSLSQAESRKVKCNILYTLRARPVLSESAVQALVLALQDENNKVRSAADSALERQMTLSESTTQTLILACQHKDSNVRSAAARALGHQIMLSESAVQALIQALQHETGDVRDAAASTLGRQARLSESAVQALTQACQHEKWNVKFAAARALGSQTPLSESMVRALIEALQHEDRSVRSGAVHALGTQIMLSKIAVQALTQALQNNEDRDVRVVAAHALGSEKMLLSEAAVQNALIQALQDEDSDVSVAAVRALNSEKTLSEAAVQIALIEALQHEDYSVWSAVQRVLEERGALSEAAVQNLIQALQHEDSKVRSAAASELEEWWEVIQALIQVLQDNEDGDVRYTAVSELERWVSLSKSAVQALTPALQDRDNDVRSTADRALERLNTLSNTTYQVLHVALHDEDSNVRLAADRALKEWFALPETAVLESIEALQHENPNVSAAAVFLLGWLGVHSEAAIQAVIPLLQHEDKFVRSGAARALRRQPSQTTWSETAVRALIPVLQHGDSDARYAAARVLWDQETLPATVVQALISILEKDKDSNTRYAAVSALCSERAMSETAVQAVLQASQDEDRDVRSMAVTALGVQTMWTETIVQTIIQALQHEDVGTWGAANAASFRAPQRTMPKAAIQALIQALQHENRRVWSAAAHVLSLQLERVYTMLPELEEDQIRIVYKRILLSHSLIHTALLYVRENRLHFYTPAGPQSVPVEVEQIDKLTQAFTAVQTDLSKLAIEDSSDESESSEFDSEEPDSIFSGEESDFD